jgi:filamentous hemagglutinin family protein
MRRQPPIQQRSEQNWRLIGTLRRSRAALLCGTALTATALSVVALPAAAQPAPNAQPQGGRVVAGAASIAQGASTTTVNQSSQRAAVNWTSFDVGSQQAVVFNQPSASSVTLNRVTAPNPSAIAGKITANGSLVIVNQSGVVFMPGSQVDAQGVIISAAGITNRNFMSGNMVFDQPGNPNAAVVNQGTLTVKQAGLAALVAPQVANSGVINARLGHVVLAGAAAATLDMYGDGLVAIDVTKQVSQTPVGADGKPVTVLVTNTGTVRADGGTVQITAAAADGVVQTLVHAGGRIEADSVGSQPGSVVIDGTGGGLVVDGAVMARGRQDGTTGGQVQLAASGTVALAPTARVDASGRAGGGTVAVGTTLARAKGGRSVTPTLTAAAVTVAPGARIKADATRSGTGGTVTLLSTGTTDFAGTIDARGGPDGGNGGLIELSGGAVTLGGTADAGAPAGGPWETGSILLDPNDLAISTTQPVGYNTNSLTPVANPGVAAATDAGGEDWVTPTQLAALTGNVTLAAAHDVLVLSNFTAPAAITALTLDAGHNVEVNSGVTLSVQGNLVMIAADSALAATPTGTIQFLNATAGTPTVVTTTGTLSLTAGSTDINLGGSVTAAALVVSAGAGLVQTATDATSGNANVLHVSGILSGSAGSISLFGANAIGTLGGLTANSGGIAITEATGQALTVAAAVATPAAGQTLALTMDTLTLTAGGALNAGTGVVALAPATSGNGVAVTTATVGTGTLDLLPAALASVTAGTLVLGSGSTGPITLGVVAGGAHATDVIDLAADGIGQLILDGTAVTEGSDTVLRVGTLAGTVTSAALIGSGNTITTLAGFSVGTGAFTLDTAGPLTLAGDLVAGTADLVVAGLLSESGGLISATTLTGSAGTADLTGANAISTLAGFSVGSGAFTLDQSGELVIAGVLVAGTADFGIDQLLSETGSGAIQAGTLTATDGAIALFGANEIGTLGALTSTSGDIAITEATGQALTVAGVVATPAASHTIELTTDTLSLAAGGSLHAGTGVVALAPSTSGDGLVVTGAAVGAGTLDILPADLAQIVAGTLILGSGSTGPITLGVVAGAHTADTIDLGAAGIPSLTLDGTAVTEGSDTVLRVGTLAGTATSAALIGSGNTITTLAGFSVGTGAFTLDTAGTLALAGTLTAATADLVVAGLLSESGGVISATTLTGSAGTAELTGANAVSTLAGFSVGSGAFTLDQTGSLTIAGVLVAGTADFGIGGLLSETGSGAIQAGTLTGSDGTISLLGANQIGTLGALTSTGGGIAVTEATGQALTVAGAVATPATGQTIALTTDTLSLAAGAALDAGTGVVALAPATSGDGLAVTTATVGAGTLDILPTSLAQVTAGTLLLGSGTTGPIALGVAAGGGHLADTIDLTFDGIGQLALDGTAVTEGSDTTLRVGTLSGTASSAALIGSGNTITTLAGFSVGTGAFTLDQAGSLTIAGVLVAGTADFGIGGLLTETGGTIQASTLTGSDGTISLLGANQIGTLGALTSTGGGIAITEASGQALTVGGAVATPATGETIALTADTLTLPAGGALDAGSGVVVLTPATSGDGLAVTTATIGAGTLDILPAELARITAGTLLLGSGTTGPITLGVAAGGGHLADTIDLAAAGLPLLKLDGTAVTEGSDTVLRIGTLAGTATSVALIGSGNTITTLAGFSTGGVGSGAFTLDTAGSLTLAGNLVTGTADLGVAGLLSESGGVIVAGTLTGSDGTVSLLGANQIGALGALASTGGGIAIAEATGQPLTVAGAVTTPAGGETLALTTDTLTLEVSGTLDAGSGVVALAPSTSGDGLAVTSAAVGAGTLDLLPAELAQITAGTLLLGSGTTGPITLGVAAGGGHLADTIDLAAHAIPLLTLDGTAVTEGSDTALRVGTLAGTATSVALIGSGNTIATLAGFSVGTGAFTLDTAGSLTLAGSMVAGTADLVAAGLLSEAGGIVSASTLTGSAGTVSLLDANLIGTLGALTATSGGLAVTEATGQALVVGGAVQASGQTIALDMDTLSFAAGGALNAGTGLVALAPATTADGVALIASGTPPAGALAISLSELSNVTAATLQLGTTSGGQISVGNAGDVIDLTGLVGTLSLLSAAGVAQGSDATLRVGVLEGNAGTVQLTGNANTITTLAGFSVGTGAFTLDDTGSLVIAGSLVAGTAELSVASLLSETGGITVGTLTASGGTVELVGGNTITTLAGLNTATGGGYTLDNTGGLTLDGSIGAATVLTIDTTGGLTVPGTLTGATIDLTSTGLLNIGGTVGGAAATAVALAGQGGITLTGSVAGGTVSLGGGAVEDASTSTLSAGTLTSAGTLQGSVTLAGTVLVDTLDGFAATGNVFVSDGSPLLLGGTIAAGTGASLTLLDDSLGLIAAGATLSAPSGTIELAARSSGQAITIGGGSFASGAAFDATRLQFGSSSTGPITIGGTLALRGQVAELALVSLGTISESGGALDVATLTGSSGGGLVVLNGVNGVGTTNTVDTLDGFSSVGGFTLTDADSLTVIHTVTATGGVDSAISLSSGGDLALGTPTTGAAIGDGLTTLALNAGGGISESSLTSLAGVTLSGSAGGSVALALGANSIGTLGGFTSGTGFTLTNDQALILAGSVSDPTGITLTTTSGALVLDGTLATGTGSGVLDLAAAGSISEGAGGALTGATLAGTAGGAVALVAGLDSIGTLASFTSTGGFTLADQTALVVTGPVSDLGSAGTIDLTSVGTLTLGGTVTAPDITLTGAAILQTLGLVNAGTLLSLSATGAMTQTAGTLEAATLTGAAGGSVDLGQSVNIVHTLAGFVAGTLDGSGFTLADTPALTVTGTLGGPAAISLSTAGSLTLAGTLSSNGTLTLAATGVDQTGGTIDVAALAGSLSGSTAAATLDSTANSIGTLGNFTADGGLLFTDAGALSIAGTVTGAPIRIRDDSVTFAATGLLDAGSGTVALAPFAIGDAQTLAGGAGGSGASSVTAALLVVGGDLSGTVQAGSLALPAAINLAGASTLDLLSSGDIAQSGSIVQTGGTLTGSAVNVTLTGPGNQFATLAGFTATGSLTLENAAALAVSGMVTAGSTLALDVTGGGIALATGGTLAAPAVVSLITDSAITEATGAAIVTPSGTLTGSAGAYVALALGANSIGTLGGFTSETGFTLTDGQALTLAGSVSDPTGITLTTTSGALLLDGTLASSTISGVLDLIAAGSISQSGGVLTAASLTGSAGLAVALVTGSNTITTLGSFSSTGGFTLSDQTRLDITGPVTDLGSAGTIDLTSTGTLTLGGTIVAPDINLAGAAIRQTLGLVNAGTLLSLSAGGAITQSGGTLEGTGTLTLLAGGAITQAPTIAGGAVIDAATLTGSAGGSVDLGQNVNAIDTLTGFVAGTTDGSGFTLADASALTVTGTLGGPAAISLSTAGSLTLAGTLSSNGTLTLAAAGVDQTGGTIAVAALAGSLSGSTAAATLDSTTNSIGTLADFTADGGFLFTDAGALTIAGTLIGAPIRIRDDSVTFGSAGLLNAGGGKAALAPFTTGDTQTLAGGAGGGGASSVTAALLVVGGDLSGTVQAGSLVLPAAINLAGASTLDLLSSGDIAQSGSIVQTGGTLTGSAVNVTLTGPGNQFATLAGFTATGSLALDNTSSLAVVSLVTAGSTLALDVTGGGIALASGGTLAAPAVVSLITDSAITEASNAAILTPSGTLTGSAALGVGLTATGNAIGTLGGFTSETGFTLTDDQALILAGLVSDPTGITLQTTAGGLTLAGTLATGTVTGVLDLLVSGGIMQTGGALTGATLLGTAGGLVVLADGFNTLPTLAGFLTGGGFTLADQGGLEVTGLIDPSTVSLSSTGAMVLTNSLTANDITLSGASIQQISGTVDATDTLTLLASGAITQAPTVAGAAAIDAVTLTGSAGGSVDLGQSVNAIDTLAGFSAAAGFTLADASSLTVIGTLSGPQAISLSTAGSLTLAGTLSSNGTLTLAATGVDQTGGTIAVAALAGSLSGSTAAATLDSTTNSIGTLADFTADGGFLVTDAGALSIAGTVTGAPIRIRDDSVTFAATGLLDAGSGTVALAPFAIGDAQTLAGGAGGGGASSVTAALLVVGGDLSGTVQASSLVLPATINLSGASTLDLLSSGDIAQSGSIVQTGGTLTGSAVNVTLTGPGNQFATLAGFTATGSLDLENATSLAVAALVTAGSTLALDVTGGGIALATGGTLAAPAVVSLITDSAITEATGAAILTPSGTLTGSAGGSVALSSTGNAIGTLGGFTSETGFTLTDDQALTLAGSVSDPTGITLTTTSGALLLDGTLDTSASTGVLDLVANGSITETGGVLTGATLIGSAGGAVALTDGVNTIPTLGVFTSVGGFTLADRGGLAVTGTFSDSTSLGLVSAGALTLEGTLTAPTIDLTTTSGGITQTAGLLNAGTLLTLIAAGSVSQTGGTLETATLTGSAGGTVALGASTANIATLDGFTSVGGFTLADAQALTVAGSVTDSASLGLTTSGSLALTGTLSAPTQALVATGAITQAGGAILAGTLAASAAAVTLDSTSNRIGTLTNVSASAGLALTDAEALTIAGTLTVADGDTIRLRADTVTFGSASMASALGGTVALAPFASGDTLTLAGGNGGGGATSVTADTLLVGSDTADGAEAGALALTGGFNLSGVRLIDLLASGNIVQTGSIVQPTGTLTGSGANVGLAGAGNEFATLATFTAGGSLSLVSAGQGLLVAGAVQTGSSLALDVTGGGITLGTAATPATLTAPGLVRITTDSAVSAPDGTITAATLALAAASATLSGANDLGTLGGATVTGGMSLTDATGLVIAAPVTAGSLALTVSGDLSLAANVTAQTIALAVSGAVSQGSGTVTVGTLDGSAASISLGDLNAISTLGPLTVSGAVVLDNAPSLTLTGGLSASTVQITESGDLKLNGDLAATTLQFTAGGSLAQTAGLLRLGTLSGSAATVSLGDANQIATIGGLTSTGAVLVSDAADLALTGALSAGGAVTLQISGTLSETGAGSLTAPSLTGNAAAVTFEGSNSIGTLAGFSAAGGLAFRDLTSLGVSAPVTAGTIDLAIAGDLALDSSLTATLIRLAASGALTQPGGVMTATTLAGSAASAHLGDANSIGTLADFAIGSALLLDDAGSLVVAGPVSAGAATLVTGGALTFAGDMSATSLAITAGGSVTQTGGTLTLGTLSGSAVQLAQLGPDATGPVAVIGTLGPFTVSGSGSQLYLDDSSALVLQPPLSADAIAITAVGSVTLLAGTITTGGAPTVGTLPGFNGVAFAGTYTPPLDTSYILVTEAGGGSVFQQLGTTVINPSGGDGLRIQANGAGVVSLGNLEAPGISLILDAGVGQSVGTLDVGGLAIVGNSGSADLTGVVNGFSGKVAARVSLIDPAPNRNYQINACPLQSVNCTVLSVQTVPVPTLSNDITIGAITDNRDDPDLLLPNVANRDY